MHGDIYVYTIVSMGWFLTYKVMHNNIIFNFDAHHKRYKFVAELVIDDNF